MNEEEVQEIIRKAADAGKLIQSGWLSYRLLVVPKDAGPVQIDETRVAFYAGAQHLFSTILMVMDATTGDCEPTEADLKKMDLVAKELGAFEQELRRRVKL